MGIDISPDEDRLLVELDQLYQVWREAAQKGLQGRYRWRRSNDTDYLYLMFPGSDRGASQGPRSDQTEAVYEEHRAAEEQARAVWTRLLVKGRMLKSARVPMVTAAAGEALRALDLSGLLGDCVRVVGSMALPAYELAAGVKLDPALHATEDMDLTWVLSPQDLQTSPSPPVQLLEALKRTDDTWTVNSERPFQLRNRQGEILDVLLAPSLADGYPRRERVRPATLESQDWLLGGMPLERVVIDLSGKPVRVVAPDPRLFALHKLYMASDPAVKASRKREKSAKDERQGLALMELIEQRMPEYPLDESFAESLPAPLRDALTAWNDTPAPSPPPARRSARLR